jgi:nitrate/TMAO reductase-like tetraheme cytochrome c subunit
MIGRGDMPETAKAEARDVVDIHRGIDHFLQPQTLVLR